MDTERLILYIFYNRKKKPIYAYIGIVPPEVRFSWNYIQRIPYEDGKFIFKGTKLLRSNAVPYQVGDVLPVSQLPKELSRYV